MNTMKETKHLEFKEKITNTFLKTVSAYANYDGGTIIFGINDNGTIVGLSDITKQSLAIENKINDSIKPQPLYSITENNKDNTISLIVHPGTSKPYLYNSKAYKRNDTSTIEVDNIELKRLILEGNNMSFEELPSDQQDLSFTVLEHKLKEKRGISQFNIDILKTLNLYSDTSGYNNAAAILADNNKFPGIDIAVFGETISIIKKRETLDNKSIIQAYEEAISIFKDYYSFEVIDSANREKVETIPETAFREATANAIIHRLWDVKSQIRVSMFNDYVEIISPGGLPTGISKDEYVDGRVSILRNPIIANVFNRLNYVETFGTGIRRIKEAYINSSIKPTFDISDNTIKVVLPILAYGLNLTPDETIVYNILNKIKAKPISEIMASPTLTFGKSKVTELLKSMASKNIVVIEGKGKGTKYRIYN